jgi:ABC-type branched-subunit amino acid transport system ATPase component
MSQVTIECKGLVKSFGGVRAVADLSVSFEAGRVTALIGPNGAGKTTLFHLIAGLIHPDGGEINYQGKRIDHIPAYSIARLGIGRLFQDVRIFNKLTTLENVLVAYRGQVGESPLGSVLHRRKVATQERNNLRQAIHYLSFVGLSDLSEARAEDLSYGQQKLLAVARLLAADAEVFLLDEPTSGVNPGMVKEIITLIRQLAAQGKTVVLIEHDMSVVIEVADWVYFMDEGQIVAFGLPDEVLADRNIRAIYLGL